MELLMDHANDKIMGKQSGYIVTTKSGKTGYTIHKDKAVNGKIIVYLTENFNPVMDENGNPKKLLCLALDLKIIGFKD